MENIAILAGSQKHFDHAMLNLLSKTNKEYKITNGQVIIGKTRYIYISNADQLRGIRIKEYIVVSGFYDREDRGEILERAKLSLIV